MAEQPRCVLDLVEADRLLVAAQELLAALIRLVGCGRKIQRSERRFGEQVPQKRRLARLPSASDHQRRKLPGGREDLFGQSTVDPHESGVYSLEGWIIQLPRHQLSGFPE